MILQGKAIAPASAVTINAELKLGVNGLIECLLNSDELLEHDIQTPSLQENIEQVKVSKSLGSIPRTITFASGWVFVVDESSQINLWLKQQNRTSLLHSFEQNTAVVVIGLLVTILSVWGLVSYGVPAVSHSLAKIVPISVEENIAEYTLEYLDEGVFKPSKLSLERQSQLTQLLADTPINDSTYTEAPLLFRSLPDTANAFTLSNGSVILTDEIIALSSNDREIQAVLLHEIGHQAHDHLMTQMIQSTLLSTLASYVIGDAVGLADTLTSVSVFAVTMQYSQDAELEADQFAAMLLLKQYGSAEDLVTILSKLDKLPTHDLVSTHPNMDARITAIRKVHLP